jgi:hypothetical protein
MRIGATSILNFERAKAMKMKVTTVAPVVMVRGYSVLFIGLGTKGYRVVLRFYTLHGIKQPALGLTSLTGSTFVSQVWVFPIIGCSIQADRCGYIRLNVLPASFNATTRYNRSTFNVQRSALLDRCLPPAAQKGHTPTCTALSNNSSRAHASRISRAVTPCVFSSLPSIIHLLQAC